ncbi:MAG: SAM-dependent methyltransferase [Sphingomonadales bacterium]
MDQITLRPIGTVRNSRAEPTDDGWDAIQSRIALDAGRFGPDALAGLDAFSHVEVLFAFHLVAEDAVNAGARHPRGNLDWPRVGIFAQRGKDRPNRLGLCICRLVGVKDTTITVRGLDAVDGSPVIDIKPWMKGFSPRGEVREPDWAAEIMKDYW